MQWTGHVDCLDVVSVHLSLELGAASQIAGQDAAILPHPLQVSPGLRVSRLGKLGQRENDQVAALQREDPLSGAEPDAKLVGLKGLGDEVVSSRAQPLDQVSHPAVRRQQNDVDVTAESTAPNSTAQIQPAHLRHFPVGDNDSVLTRSGQIERFLAISDGRHLVSETVEEVLESLRGDRIVFRH